MERERGKGRGRSRRKCKSFRYCSHRNHGFAVEFNWIFKYLLSYYHLWGNRSTSTVHTETQTHRHMHTHLFSLSFMTDDMSDALANVFHAYIAPHRIHSHLFANIHFSLYYHFNSIKARKKPTQHNIRPKVLLNLMAFSNFII